VVCGGCTAKKRPAPSLGAVMLTHPNVPQALEISLTDAPNIALEPAESIPQLTIPRRVPARPRVISAPAREPASTEETSEPIIAPELTDEQLSAAKAAVQQSLSIAERNLGLAQGKSLNAAQQDMVSKILGFVDSAREAIKNNDWQRARIQAKKAEVLSLEFAPAQ
jgi:hypothetical protein